MRITVDLKSGRSQPFEDAGMARWEDGGVIVVLGRDGATIGGPFHAVEVERVNGRTVEELRQRPITA